MGFQECVRGELTASPIEYDNTSPNARLKNCVKCPTFPTPFSFISQLIVLIQAKLHNVNDSDHSI